MYSPPDEGNHQVIIPTIVLLEPPIIPPPFCPVDVTKYGEANATTKKPTTPAPRAVMLQTSLFNVFYRVGVTKNAFCGIA
jgi:hypothetical protein